MRFAELTLKIDVFTLIQCYLKAFSYFGVYSQEILYDNMKQIVLDRKQVSSESKWNSRFEDFCRHYGFISRLCRPYRPQTKEKIESTVKKTSLSVIDAFQGAFDGKPFLPERTLMQYEFIAIERVGLNSYKILYILTNTGNSYRKFEI